MRFLTRLHATRENGSSRRSRMPVALVTSITRSLAFRALTLSLGTACLPALAAASAMQGPQIRVTRVSLDGNGGEIPGWSSSPGISADGRYIGFASYNSLLPQDQNGSWDNYIRDTVTGQLELLSVTPTGAAGNSYSFYQPDFSDDGRWVAFHSRSMDLAPVTLNQEHAFVRDRLLGQTYHISIGTTGQEGDCYGQPHISADGRFVVFPSLSSAMFPGDNNQATDVFVRDMVNGATELISVTPSGTVGNGWSGGLYGGDISADGRYVVFGSSSTNLVPGFTAAGNDVYIRDRWTGTTSLVSLSLTGVQGNGPSWEPRCSDDGRFVAFTSRASDLVVGDVNGFDDVFVRDLQTGTTTPVTVSPMGVASNNVSEWPGISPDGRFVTVRSLASNLVPGDTNGKWDEFLYDLVAHRMERVSTGQFGVQGDGDCLYVEVAREARHIIFMSHSTNLVPFDFNGQADIFLRKAPPSPTFCSGKQNSAGCYPVMSSTGQASASSPGGFTVEASLVLNHRPGLLLYSTAGPAAIPFGGGTLCLLPPVRRTAAQNSGGSATGLDCSGSFAFDFNAWIASGMDPVLVAGAVVWAQYWSRDPGFPAPDNMSLTDAQTFEIGP